MEIESQKLRQVTICIQYQDSIILNQEKSLPSFKYNPNFDPWDNLAATRYLYELSQNLKISDDDQYVTMMTTDKYKEFLQLFNEAQIIQSSKNHKIFHIKTSENIILPSEFTLSKLDDKEQQDEFTQKIISKLGQQKTEGFYALLDTWEPNCERMRNIIEGNFYGIYQSKNERWKSFKVYLDQYPTEEELSQINGFVISGSPFGVYDDVKWFDKFFEFVRKLSHHKLILGSCFGHQSLAHALGGRVIQMPTKIVNHGPRNVRGKINLGGKDFESLTGFMCHGDEVVQVPPDLEVCFTSDYCAVQGLRGKNIFSTQFHPEFNNIFIKFIIKIMDRNLDEETSKLLQSQLTLQNQDCYIWRKICKNFLKGKNEKN